jgi:hypothetical protein
MALTMQLAAVPVLAGLVVGTGAAATFVSTSAAPIPAEATTAATQPASRPCEAQTWPYIDRACLGLASGAAARLDRPVRIVAAPRTSDVSAPASGIPAAVPASAPPVTTAAPGADVPLVSSDTVLRQPQNPAAESAAPAPQLKKKKPRRETRRKRQQWSAQSYQVPMELRGAETRPVIVVRPLRYD